MRDLWMVFLSVFLAELGDKTQVATLLFATDGNLHKWGVFAASAGALALSCLLMVVFGSQIAQFISPERIKILAGLGFIAIGIWTLVK
ncbi:MAG: hypothetical protein COV67_05290 [Nitrospinae bacterium CG11_big_fil_rev_8_21_14_0_20_56_8]|nr:MAG: hypothetical protein COV67_05290 [Nitrospinae bacterium CG11_big_fil_rev_8_21_14_0_20_56_8]